MAAALGLGVDRVWPLRELRAEPCFSLVVSDEAIAVMLISGSKTYLAILLTIVATQPMINATKPQRNNMGMASRPQIRTPAGR